jgi:hypothetical protein
MKIYEILCEDVDALNEGPKWDAAKSVAGSIGRGLGNVATGTAGVLSGTAGALAGGFGRGYSQARAGKSFYEPDSAPQAAAQQAPGQQAAAQQAPGQQAPADLRRIKKAVDSLSPKAKRTLLAYMQQTVKPVRLPRQKPAPQAAPQPQAAPAAKSKVVSKGKKPSKASASV